MEKDYFVLYTPDIMNKAFSLIESNFSREDIFNILKCDDDIKKQVALIQLEELKSSNETDILVSVLTGQHGPVREICSAKINHFLKEEKNRKFFKGEKMQEIFLNALNDIIPTVARNILEVIKFLPEADEILQKLMNRIIDLDNYVEDKNLLSKHEIIKKNFKLYWYLEALSEFAPKYSKYDNFCKIVERTYSHEDYTIREKVAKLLSLTEGFDEYKRALKQDTNPYVFSKLL
jgi:hypothetical protein